MSKKCQNRLSIASLRVSALVNPRFQSLNINTATQIKPIVICSPCVPTSTKKDDKNALARQLWPSLAKRANSLISIAKKAAPSKNVAPNQTSPCFLSRRCAAMVAKPQVKLLVKRINVSTSTNFRLNSSWPDGPPYVSFLKIANTANKVANKTQSVIKYTQKPKTFLSYVSSTSS